MAHRRWSTIRPSDWGRTGDGIFSVESGDTGEARTHLRRCAICLMDLSNGSGCESGDGATAVPSYGFVSALSTAAEAATGSRKGDRATHRGEAERRRRWSGSGTPWWQSLRWDQHEAAANVTDGRRTWSGYDRGRNLWSNCDSRRGKDSTDSHRRAVFRC